MIKCPECNTVQGAIYEDTPPFGTFIHTCVKCEYIIMESEWEEIKPFTCTIDMRKHENPININKSNTF